MDYFKDPKKPKFRHRYVGQTRPGWFRDKKPTWVVEEYVEYSSYPDFDSTWAYREVSRCYDWGEILLEYRRFTGTN